MALRGGLQQPARFVEAQATRWLGELESSSAEPRRPGLTAVAQERRLGQIAGSRRQAAAVEGRAAHGKQLFVTQLHLRQSGPAAGAVANGNIDAIAIEIDHFLRGAEVHIDTRMAALKVVQARGSLEGTNGLQWRQLHSCALFMNRVSSLQHTTGMWRRYSLHRFAPAPLIMKLYYAKPPPYARRVRVLLRERGLLSRIDEIA